MKNHYETLGINSSATDAEIRRAYRVLARRYHPDVNASHEASEKFKTISEAYRVLKDADKRKVYDREFDSHMQKTAESRFNAFKRKVHKTATERYYQAQKRDYDAIKSMQNEPRKKHEKEIEKEKVSVKESMTMEQVGEAIKKSTQPLKEGFSKMLTRSITRPPASGKHVEASNVTVMEVSVSMLEALNGTRKSVEVESQYETKKIKVNIPAGVRHGTVLRLRSTKKVVEEVVIIVRVARHPFLRIEPRGLVMEIPITISEAINGVSIKVPTTDEPVLLKVPPHTQGGTELRLKGKGVHEGADGRGDLFVRLSIRIPEAAGAAGLSEKAREFDVYYEESVRDHLPSSLKELEST